MQSDWDNAVVIDPRELQSLKNDNARLRKWNARLKLVVGFCTGLSLATGTGLWWQSGHVNDLSREARDCHKSVARSSKVLSTLSRSHEQILAATEQAPSVGTKSWGRRFTVTKYLPRSEAYGKDNDGLTATLIKADPAQRIVAVDPKLIPYGSKVWVEGLGWFNAQDCGGAIKGFRLDLMTATLQDAMAFGKQDRFVIVVPPTV
jgi:3D (Asp-Asp-Asp) domain-containing protein